MKGRKIRFQNGIRPTQNKIRKAIFDCLGDSIKNSLFLELFAGSGAVGIEALSHGARQVSFVEKESNCLKLIESNLKLVEVGEHRLYKKDSLQAIKYLSQGGMKFDIIFLDPPYEKDLAKKSLLSLSVYDIVAPQGIIVVEHHKKEELPKGEGSLILFKQKRYGDKVLSFYKKA